MSEFQICGYRWETGEIGAVECDLQKGHRGAHSYDPGPWGSERYVWACSHFKLRGKDVDAVQDVTRFHKPVTKKRTELTREDIQLSLVMEADEGGKR